MRPSGDAIEAVRRFNRAYTRRIGALDRHHAGSAHTLAEARVLYELGTRAASATAIQAALGLDAGYLSRILARFERQGLVTRAPSAQDRRARDLALTPAGRAVFEGLDARSQALVAALLAPLSVADRGRVAAAMGTIEGLLDGPAPDLRLRPHAPGDLGWIVSRHGALYAREHGFDASFEAAVAGIAARVLERFDPGAERVLIAERGGERLGSTVVVREGPDTARLRFVLVEPEARGLGLGRRLIAEALAFARGAGYARVVLSTLGHLSAARALYRDAGFRCTGAEERRLYGQDLIEEEWALALPS